MWTSGETIVSTRLVDKNDLNLSGQYAGIAGASLSSGGIVFANASGALLNDTGLFWDQTNHGLGLMTSSPTSKLTIQYDSPYSGNEAAAHAINIITGIGSTDHQLHMGADLTNDLAYIQSTGNQDFKPLLLQGRGGKVGIGQIPTGTSLLEFNLTNIPIAANNAAASSGGVVVGGIYRTNADPSVLCIRNV